MYGVVNLCHFDYASLIWIELVELVKWKKESTKTKGPYIPFVKFIKLLIQLLMATNHVSARINQPTVGDHIMHNL